MRRISIPVTAAAAVAVAFLATLFPVERARTQDRFGDILIQLEQRLPNIWTTGYPPGATAQQASSGNVAAATATATLPAVAAKTTWLSGFTINAGGATAASIVNCTVTGPLGGTLTIPFVVIAGATLANNLTYTPPVPVPGSAVNTAIVVSCPTLGAGNTNMAINAYGFAYAPVGQGTAP